VAHSLAREAALSAYLQVYDSIPNCIQQAIAIEISNNIKKKIMKYSSHK